MYIGKTFGPSRRNMDVELYLTNVGNAPAIDVLVDAEVILEYSSINGEKGIPTRFEPACIPFIGVGERVYDYSIYPNFGNTCITHILERKKAKEWVWGLKFNLYVEGDLIPVWPCPTHYSSEGYIAIYS